MAIRPGPLYVTKGDANRSTDDPVMLSAITGKVIATVPLLNLFFGYFFPDAHLWWLTALPLSSPAVLLVVAGRFRSSRTPDSRGRQAMIDALKAVRHNDWQGSVNVLEMASKREGLSVATRGQAVGLSRRDTAPPRRSESSRRGATAARLGRRRIAAERSTRRDQSTDQRSLCANA